jgi:hypothetical protein
MSFNFSHITDDLFIGTTPLAGDYDGLRQLGIRLIINMRFTRRPFPDTHQTPIQLLWLRTIDSPFVPLPISKLMIGARSALKTINQGGKIYVHCAYGRHRGPAMGTCVLIAQGYQPGAAMNLVVERRAVADPYTYYIRSRILKFAQAWNGEKNLPQTRGERRDFF